MVSTILKGSWTYLPSNLVEIDQQVKIGELQVKIG